MRNEINGIKINKVMECYPAYVELGELLNKVKHSKCNRCYVTNKEDGEKLGYSEKEVKNAKARISKTSKVIFGNDHKWNNVLPLIIGGKDNTIIDAQGRLGSYENDLEKGVITEKELIPCLIYPNMTDKEIEEAIILSNINRKNWDNLDIIHFYKETGNDFAKEISRKIIDLKNNALKGYSEKSICVMLLGEGVSHTEKIVSLIDKGSYNKNKDLTINIIRTIYDEIHKERGLANCKVAIKKVNYVYSMIRFINGLVKYCANNKYDINNVQNELIECVIRYCTEYVNADAEISRAVGDKLKTGSQTLATALLDHGGKNGRQLSKSSHLYNILMDIISSNSIKETPLPIETNNLRNVG